MINLRNFRFFIMMICAFSINTLFITKTYAQPIDMVELMKPGHFGDVWLGSESAKVTMIEYASLTCPHCADFHNKKWKLLKEKYIDKGLVRFTMREFPKDKIATSAFMIARCEGPEKYYHIIGFLFSNQKDWAFVEPPQIPIKALEDKLPEIGVGSREFYDCLQNQSVYSGVQQSYIRANKFFGVEFTPTFFINGKKYVGNMEYSELENIIDGITKNSQ